MIVGDSKGVWKTRTIHRKPFEERWAEKLSEMVVGVPWNTSDEDMKADGPKMQEVMVMPWRGADESASGIEREGVPRRLRIVKEDLYAYGFSQNCPGCKAVLQNGKVARNHTEACRRRIENEMKNDPRMAKTKDRLDDFYARAIETAEDERKKNMAKVGEPGTDRSGDATMGHADTLAPARPVQEGGRVVQGLMGR
jgi:hypothetical protein